MSRIRHLSSLFLILSLATPSLADPQHLDPAKLTDADRAIDTAIAAGKCPGAVLCVGSSNGILYQKAYGHRSLQPTTQPMTVDTIFDLASLSKPVGCSTSAMILIDQRKLSISEKVITYLPAFNNH